MARRLRSNVDLNDFSIRVEQMAVSDRRGRLPLFDNLSNHNYSASLEGQGPDAARYLVDVCSLDDYVAASTAVSVGPIKIDVERHEPAAVRGMMGLITAHRPPIIVEILDSSIGTEVERLITGIGYRVFHICEKRGLVPTIRILPRDEHDWNHLLCTERDFTRAGLQKFLA
jgi:FkbM family methyltransferase